MDMTEFLLARDESVVESGMPERIAPECGCTTLGKIVRGMCATHYDRWVHLHVAVGYSRWMAECEAKRRIVELHRPDVDVCVPSNPDDDAAFYAPWCPTLQAVAVPYADHPSYDEAWRP